MSRLFISAAHKSSGKTTVSIGLCAALSQRGHTVQAYKKGPDYIDPMWLSRATQRPCHNLDFYTMQEDEILSTFQQYNQDADISIIEGNKGLYDGLSLDGSNSNAALAKKLKAPVILVIDARGMTRGIAPLILGYEQFDPDINIAGVILNQLGGSRHENKLRNVIEHYTDVHVIGAVHRDNSMEIVERHLGLMPSNEDDMAQKKIHNLAGKISEQVDLDNIVAIAAQAPQLAATPASVTPAKQARLRIGIAKDAAFGFYYPGDMLEFQRQGAELVYFDTLNDPQLPDVDALFIGGGFPEIHMQQLSANQALRGAIKTALENNMPCYAECGGLMYLARCIEWQGQQSEMVGLLPFAITMHDKPQGRGYIQINETDDCPWKFRDATPAPICAHEFHYSGVSGLPADMRFAFQVQRGTGINGQYDGIVYKNTLASYAHLRHTRQSPWITGFLEFVQTHKPQ